MSMTKKRKSDVHIDICARDNADHQSKKEKHWFEETDNRGGSFLKGIFNKVKSSTNIRSANKTVSTSKLEPFANDTQISINSESSVTSAESSSNSFVPNIAKNAGLKTFLNRDSSTPVPYPETERSTLILPEVGCSKQDVTARMEDSISLSSHMSVDTIGSSHTIDEDSTSIGSTSAFCTPSRNTLHRSAFRMSTRSVPEKDDMPTSLFDSLCNSTVRSSRGGPMRRSMRMTMQKRGMNSKSMEDVPEEEALTVSSSSAILNETIDECDEERFECSKEFFDKNVSSHIESTDEGTCSMSRLSTASESRLSSGATSIGRKSSILRKLFHGKNEGKERRMSDVFSSAGTQEDVRSVISHGRRASIVSFTNDCSFTGGMGAVATANASTASMTSNDSTQKSNIRKKTPSTSNISQRLSSVFRKVSSSTAKEEDFSIVSNQSNRRNTLTGYSSISSGIGSIASGTSDQGYGTLGSRSGHSISRSGSRRDDDSKRERSRRLLDRIIISEIPAGELLKLKSKKMKQQNLENTNETFEAQLKESNNSADSTQNELLDFDVIAVDLKPDGSPFSSTAAAFLGEGLGSIVKEEMRSNFRPDKCGAVTDCMPELVFVCQEPPQNCMRGLNDSISSTNDSNSDLLRNVRGGLCKSIEEWKKISKSRSQSTMLIYPMFCQCEAEWDSKATIDAIFLMLDGILMNARRWTANGKCILAGITPTNVRLLRNKYEELKQAVELAETDKVIDSVDNLDAQSITSASTVFGTKL